MTELVSIQWLKENLNNQELILLDASPPSTAEGKVSEYEDQTIPGARFFDLKNKFSDPKSEFPNTIPSEEQFEAECRKLGINQSSEIVVFDNLGIYTSPRVWWMFKAMGHDKVSVLDGGLPEWIKEGNETVDRKEESYETGEFHAQLVKNLVRTYHDILENVDWKSFCIVDARSAGRFDGTAPDPRKLLQSGNIPNSVNIPYVDVLENGKFKSKSELRKLFEEKCSGEENLVYSCGSGLTACIIMLAGEIADQRGKAVYDGSWTEWAELQGLTNPSP